MALHSTQAPLRFQPITVSQFGQSSTEPDYYYPCGAGGIEQVGVVLGDGTHGFLLNQHGFLWEFESREEARRFCMTWNRKERARVRRLTSSSKPLEDRQGQYHPLEEVA